MLKKISFSLLFIAFGLCFTSQSSAQEVTASAYGRVMDDSGAVIPGAEVILRNIGTNRLYRAITDDTGSYAVTQVPPGEYEASTEMPGFRRAVVTGITLRVNDRRRIDFTLEVGEISEQVTVSASTVTVDTASGATSNIMTSEDIVQLPSSGRNVMPFAMVMPGVVSDSPNSRRDNRHAVNGIRPTHNAWLLDGGYNIDTGGNWSAPLAPNLETVSEFRAIRSNYSAEFGMGGGSQFNVVTKSGTNEFHGALYWYHRNSAMNARNFFSPDKDSFRDNDFGGSIGGPVWIPGLYDGRDRTFFFVLLGTRTERSDQRFFAKLPEVPYRSGDFSSLGTEIIDPGTDQPFPGNIIPDSRIDPNARIYMSLYPSPNFSDERGNNFTITRPSRHDLPQQNYRIDHHFNDDHRVMVRYVREDRDTLNYTSPGFDFLENRQEVPANNTVVNFYSTFSPTLINEFNFTRSHNRIMNFPPSIPESSLGISIPELVEDSEANYPLDHLNLSEIPDRAPTFALVNYAGIAPASPWSNWQSIFDFKDNLTWVRGPHTFKFGFDYAYEKKFEPTESGVFGHFGFDGRFTGDALADFLLGMAESYRESSAVGFNDNRRHAFELYIDDTWRTTPRLTLNLGVRYSYFPPAYEPDERFRSFWPEAYDPANAVTVTDDGQVVRDSGDRFNGLINPKDWWDYTPWNFAPRLGFYYDLSGNGRTALRGGYGIFYSREILGAFILMSANPPFAEQLEFFNTNLSNPAGGSTRDFDVPINLGSIDINQHIPYTQQWNLNIQHGLFEGTVLEVAYAGSRATHMMRSRDINQPEFNPEIALGEISANALRPYKGWGTISHREQSYSSNYHGLQVGLNRNFRDGFGLKVGYTWSKAIDNADFSGGIYGVSPYYPNALFPNGERGLANFDASHRFVASYIYEIPWLRNRNDFIGKAFGGWSFSGITTFQVGLPFTPQLGRDLAGIGYSTRQRPVMSGDPELDNPTVGQWFNTSVFSAPEIGTLAPTGRNTMRLPGTNNWDLTLAKDFRMGETTNLNVRVEAYNAFNHTQFSGLGSNFNAASFGSVTSAADPRTLQVGLRLSF